MKIYIDSDYKCHVANPDGSFREVEATFFDGKCQIFIEGYCYDDSKDCVAIYPWKQYNELAEAQRQYEADQAELAAAYQEGVNSV